MIKQDPSNEATTLSSLPPMQYVNLGNTGVKVSRICLGTMSFGDPQWRPWVLDEGKSIPIIKTALDCGINFFDCADMYSLGKSEEIVGKALKSYNHVMGRDQVVITSKVWAEMGKGPNQKGLSRKHIMESVDASLKRLGTHYIDLYQIHKWEHDTPIEETMEALNDLVRSGKVMYIGASNVYAWQVAKVNNMAQYMGWKHRIVSVQNEYSLLYREDEREMIPMSKSEGIALIPYSPLCRGYLSGKKKQHWTSEKVDTNTSRGISDPRTFERFHKSYVFETLNEVESIAKKYNSNIPRVSLAWMLHKNYITAPIIGATCKQHVIDAVMSLNLKLSNEDMLSLEKHYQPQPYSPN